MTNNLINQAKNGNLIIMAGAGLSAGWPTALPGWYDLNAAFLQVLRLRLESTLERPEWLAAVVAEVDTRRDAARFPPEYQAQLLEEMCGERYFQGLQALDIDIVNSGHTAIAALAATGAVRAVVTTNFDRLIEQALEQQGISYRVAYADAGYVTLADFLDERKVGPLPIIKIHGCVSDHLSLIDTLKQRHQGRSQHLEACLASLQTGYWLYLGFSAADLEGNPHYLGLVPAAPNSAGATYVAYPGNPTLGPGAQLLLDAYGPKGQVLVADIADQLAEVLAALGVPAPVAIPADEALGPARFQEQLTQWANALSPAAAGLCLAAIAEAAGQAEAAVRLLDRLVRKELYGQRDTADFRALQLHYGRLGAAWGRFIAVPDLQGMASNASVEAVQSLFRLLDSEFGFAARGWLAAGWLWLNKGESATQTAFWLLPGFLDEDWPQPPPNSDEEAVDGWLSAAQVCLFNTHQKIYEVVLSSAPATLALARSCGDVVRAARVIALHHLVLAEVSREALTLSEREQADFAEAARVGDGFALGLHALALGRWYVGPGGLALARQTDPRIVAETALTHLEQAGNYFSKQGMDPWLLFTRLQQVKAYADLQQVAEAQAYYNVIHSALERFPILASHTYETAWQVQSMLGDENAGQQLQLAITAAGESGLEFRKETLLGYAANIG